MSFQNLVIKPRIAVNMSKNVGAFANAVLIAFGFGDGDTQYGSGAGAGNVGQVYTASRTITSGVADSINLSSQTQPDGSSAVFTDVCVLSIKNTGAANITVGAGSNPFSTIWGSGTITIPPGVTMTFNNPNATGYVVTASTADKIQVTTVGGGSYDVFVAGH